ncbi:hypothetical protein [Thiolapillus sp.]|uniref:hypothetical protein n=1 Tax=Thiolapillus sp. TaxID=2017437 RepID=UPI003AF98E7E
MFRSKQIIVVLMALLFMSHAHAHKGGYIGAGYDNRHYGYDNSIERRMNRQQYRIDAGIREGSLTAREVRKLHRAHRRFARLERRLGYDGYWCERDVKRLHRRLDRISRKIYRFKHNRRYNRHLHHGNVDRWQGHPYAAWKRVPRIEYERTGALQSNAGYANPVRW